MLIALAPLAFAIVGALMYALSTNGKVSELGRLMFFAGLFWLVYLLSGKTLRIG